MVAEDSKVTIDWINSKSNLNLIYVNNWKDKIKSLNKVQQSWRQFLKDGTQRHPRMAFYEEIVEEVVVNTWNFYIFYCVTIQMQLYDKSSICHWFDFFLYNVEGRKDYRYFFIDTF